jgi:two-component system LytT family response regulator
MKPTLLILAAGIGSRYGGLKQKIMKFFEAHLPAEDFVRIHRSYIVKLSEISQMQLYEKESYIVILKNGAKLPVSKSGLPRLKKKLDF